MNYVHVQVVCGEDIEGDKDEWFSKEPDRFYFYEAYDRSTKSFVDPPPHTRGAGSKGKVSTIFLGSKIIHSFVILRAKVKGRAR